MKNVKKHLARLLAVVMMFSLLSLPEGLVAKAADNIPYLIYFDADNGELYKVTEKFSSSASSWTPTATEKYEHDSITCSGRQLTLHDFNFSLLDTNTAIVIQGDATINLVGENKITHSHGSTLNSQGGYGIYTFGDLSFTGDGKLECNANDTGIHVTKSLTVEGATITSVGEYLGIYTGDNFTINSGFVEGKVKSGGQSTSAYEYTGIRSNNTIQFNGGTLIGNSTKFALTAGTDIKTNSNTVFWDKDNTEIHPNLTSMGNKFYTVPSQGLLTYLKLTIPVIPVTDIKTEMPTEQNVVIGGEPTNLTVSVEPADASDPTIKWTSSDDSIVSVDDNGTITANKAGTATITATTPDGNHKKEFTITVSKAEGGAAPTGITAVPPTTVGGSDGKLVGVNNTMEYSINKDFTDAKDCTGSEVTGLPAGTYYVRVKETDTTKAGVNTTITVPQAGSSSTGTGSNPNNPSASGDGTGTNTTGTPSKSEQSIMDSLGVSADTAKQILDEAAKLGISESTLLITDASIKSQKSDADLKGSSFGLLKAQATNLKSNAITVKWSKVKNADGYIIYGNKCGAKNSYKKLKTIKKNSTCKFTQKKLKKGTYYKYLVVAYKKIAGTTVTISAAKTIHATTTGGKYGVAKAVKVNQTKKTLSPKKTFKIKASEIKQSKTIRQHRKIKYESSNSKIASVNGKGVVKAKKKGSCDIYVYAQNGVYKKIKITVK